MRILGVILNSKKPLFISLQKIFGIGLIRAKKILHCLNILHTRSLNELEEFDRIKLKQYLESKKKTLSRSLKIALQNNKLQEILLKSYKGNRYSNNLPVRGQRTHSNCKTTRRARKKYEKKRLSKKRKKF